MPSLDPAQFYTGIVAECYAALRGSIPDPELYARFIASSGEPALELGCGDGDPLINLRQRGLDVEGLDSSPDMIARARKRADALGVMPWEVVCAADGWLSFECGVAAMMIVGVEPPFECCLPLGF